MSCFFWVHAELSGLRSPRQTRLTSHHNIWCEPEQASARQPTQIAKGPEKYKHALATEINNKKTDADTAQDRRVELQNFQRSYAEIISDIMFATYELLDRKSPKARLALSVGYIASVVAVFLPSLYTFVEVLGGLVSQTW